jgi:hypothetical protein
MPNALSYGQNRPECSRLFAILIRVDSWFYRRLFVFCPLNAYSRASIASFRSVPHW